ncbi:hypothetical protein ACVWWJ_004462 [Luteibacter sp. HA06]
MRLINHPSYRTAKSSLLAAFDEASAGSFIFLIGPSGVGKTEVRHAAMRQAFGQPAEWGRGRLPITEVYASLPHNAFFSSRSLVNAFSKQLNFPDLLWLSRTRDKSGGMLDLGLNGDQATAWYSLRSSQMTEDKCWEAMLHTSDVRGCDIFSIEFATALLVNRRNKLPADHIQHLASIAEQWKKTFLLTGVPRITELWDVFHDSRRRVLPVWFYPYNERLRRGDKHKFTAMLKSLLVEHPYVITADARSMVDELMAATAGLCGEVVKLFSRAKVLAAGDGVAKVGRRHLQKAFYGTGSLKSLWADVDTFELTAAAGDPTSYLDHVLGPRQNIRGSDGDSA